MTDDRTDASRNGASDATPGGAEGRRRPGEAVFAMLVTLGSAALLWNAYGISGFEALSAPGAIPMAATAVMLVSALIVLARTIRLPRIVGETVTKDIAPWVVLLFVGLLVGYGLLLVPLGFIPTSALFLAAAIKVLWRKSWATTLIVSICALIGIWLIFRIVFSVLMPPGVVPEAEFIQFFRNLTSGAE